VSFGSEKGAERALITADVRIVDIPVYQKRNESVGMFSPADGIGGIRKIQQAGFMKKTSRFIEINSIF